MTLRVLSATAACLLMAGCGTLHRPAPVVRLGAPVVLHGQLVRAQPSDAASMQVYADEMERLISGGRPLRILALSGGGANGAFGAGVIVGWGQRGDRPEFDVVTGVSTGALAAPYAFLGSGFDDELQATYTEGGASGLVGLDNVALLFQPSLFSAGPLKRLIDEHVTSELLEAIAAEALKGRSLLIATTNLDREETVIWDMGALAVQGDEDAKALFKEILLASASIPGAFPPVLIAATSDQGVAAYEMHVDGGVNAPFIAIPEALLNWMGAGIDRPAAADLYVIVNGVLSQVDRPTGGTFSAVITRSYQSMVKTAIRRDLALTATFAARNGLSVHVTSIPADWPSSSLDFSTEAMRLLFERGVRLGRQGAFDAALPDGGDGEPETGALESPSAEFGARLLLEGSCGSTTSRTSAARANLN